MASQFFFTSASMFFLLVSFSSLYHICHADFSPSSRKLLSTSDFLRNMNGTRKGDVVEGVSGLKKHLTNLGYIDRESSTITLHQSDEFFDDTLESAIKKYQQFYNLKITGVLDEETLELLSRPRCGVADFHPGQVNLSSFLQNITNIGSFYTFYKPGVRWPKGKTNLSYSYPKNNVNDAAHVHVARSMFRWMSKTRFQFYWEDNFSKADVKISFERRDHGDGYPFDGPLGVLAHSHPTPKSIIHFDADESWETDAQRGQTDFQSVALHELGHVLGLGHSADPKASMYATFDRGEKRRELTDDDIRGIKALYPEFK